jgi:N-methylhydantoinase A
MNAYLLPVMSTYLNKLADRTRLAGIVHEPLINASSGGLLPIATAAAKPVLTMLSGPSAGVVGAVEMTKANYSQIISFDMGGTSTDVALIEGGKVPISNEKMMEGFPLKVPTVDVVTVGAGGGSIAWVDDGGFLKVGPQSAGAIPGPACYGQGATEATVTDALMVLGYLNREALLGGRMPVDVAAAKRIIESTVGAPLGLSLEEGAFGITEVARANMERAIRVVSVDRGHDPRDFALVAYGGAGPQHAVPIAQNLGIRSVIVPVSPGTLCALGLLSTDMRSDYSQSGHFTVDEVSVEDLSEGFTPIEGSAYEWFKANNIPEELQRIVRSVDVRYLGQRHQLNVPLFELDAGDKVWRRLKDDFFREHQRLYGHSEDAACEITTLRLSAFADVAKHSQPHAKTRGESRFTAIAWRDVQFERDAPRVQCPVYAREDFHAGDHVVGPAIIEQMDTTTLLPPGAPAVVDEYLNLVIDCRP